MQRIPIYEPLVVQEYEASFSLSLSVFFKDEGEALLEPSEPLHTWRKSLPSFIGLEARVMNLGKLWVCAVIVAFYILFVKALINFNR